MHDLPLLVFNHRFKFQDSVCNVCHNLTILCVNTSDITIITVSRLTRSFLSFKHMEDVGLFCPPSLPLPILTFVLEQQWCSNLVSSFSPFVVEIMKLFKTMNRPSPLDLWCHSLPYMVKNLFCLFRRHKTSWSQLWRHKHVIIGNTNKSGINKRLLMWDMWRCFKKMQVKYFLYVSLILEILYLSSTKRSYPMTFCKNLSKFSQNVLK